LLDLVSLEGESQLACVLEHISCERDSKIEVQAELAVRILFTLIRLVLKAPQEVDLLRGLTLSQELTQRLDRARLNPGEPMELERPAETVKDVLLHGAARG